MVTLRPVVGTVDVDAIRESVRTRLGSLKTTETSTSSTSYPTLRPARSSAEKYATTSSRSTFDPPACQALRVPLRQGRSPVKSCTASTLATCTPDLLRTVTIRSPIAEHSALMAAGSAGGSDAKRVRSTRSPRQQRRSRRPAATSRVHPFSQGEIGSRCQPTHRRRAVLGP
jgi:hypothetical protein